MLLAIDIGNSNIVFGIHNNHGWKYNWRLETEPERFIGEYQDNIEQLIIEHEVLVTEIDSVVLSSVVPPITNTIVTAVKNLTGIVPLVIGPEVYATLNLDVGNPQEIGSDLVANAYAAYQNSGASSIVVDFGTALTFTYVNEKGAIKGVSIAPGIRSASGILANKTAQLPEVELKLTDNVLGTDTESAIQAGVLWGYCGMVTYMVERIREDYDRNAKVYATGGLSGVLLPLRDIFDIEDPALTLEGMRLLYLHYHRANT